MNMRASNFATIISLLVSFGFGVLLGLIVLPDSRPNVWYDMDFSFYMICFLYAFVHLFIGKVWTILITPLINVLRQKTAYSIEPHWTEDVQIIYGSFWPVSVPLAVLLFFILILFGRKRNYQSRTE